MFKEFREFISKGNVLDLAVGVIIGGAFSKIVTSLVDNIFTPLIGMIIGGLNFSSLAITVGESKLMYGAFIQSVIDFLLVALCLFIVIKAINGAKKRAAKLKLKKAKEEVEEVVEEVKDANIVLLEEIRDLLKKGRK